MKLTLDKILFQRSADLVSTKGVIIKVSVSNTKPWKFKVSVVRSGISTEIFHNWEGVEKRLETLKKEHGDLLEYNSTPIKRTKANEAEEIADEIITTLEFAQIDRSILKDEEILAKYIKRYRRDYKTKTSSELITQFIKKKL